MTQFKKNKSVFSAADSNVVNFVKSVGEFGSNFADVIEGLVSVFNVAKVYLNTLADPISAVLIPMLDSLIDTLEDLKNIGAGSLSVWPWESGVKPPEFDPSKLAQGILSLASYINHNVDVEFDQESGLIVPQTTRRRSRLVTPDDIPDSDRTKVLSQDGVMGALNGVMTMINPSLWKNEYPITYDVLQVISKFLNKRELTPSQFIDIVTRSFSDINDKDRPTGTGKYNASVMFFALPSFSELTQILQTFADFFGGLLYDEVQRAKKREKSDNKLFEIELGYPCILNGTVDSSISAKLFYNNDVSPRKHIPDKIYKSSNHADMAVLPMFQPGDIITQDNGWASDFSAEVIEHKNIKIANGQLAGPNIVIVKNVRGKIKKSNTPNVGGNIIKKTGINQDTIDKIALQKQIAQLTDKSNNKIVNNIPDEHLENFAPQNQIPMFFPGIDATALLNISNEFRGTISDDNKIITDVFPIFSDSIDSKFNSTFSTLGDRIYFDYFLINNKSFINEMVNFVSKKLKKGAIVKHPYIFNSTPSFESDNSWVQNDFYDLRKLSKIVPSLGMNLVIKEIYIADKPVSNANIEDILFVRDKLGSVVYMNVISIELGRITSSGIESEGVDLLINVPNRKKFAWEHNTVTHPFFETYKVKMGNPPNWQFLRVQELFPIYGEVIGDIIDEVEGIKGWVKNDI